MVIQYKRDEDCYLIEQRTTYLDSTSIIKFDYFFLNDEFDNWIIRLKFISNITLIEYRLIEYY